ncbi:hypothetical protein [Amphibiibacter pelophylacis]|uniref:Uncharacterized protein n=1 Tax=Amphibiibacter pelophylacis TaxID=1799477 RepID=A0ACC6P248_9BURK
MIKNFLSTSLENLVVHSVRQGIRPAAAPAVIRHISRLSVAKRASDMHLPGWSLETSATAPGQFSTAPHPQYLLTFGFRAGHAVDVDLIDLSAKTTPA